MTPGCRNVRSFLRAFRASGRRTLSAVTSKEKMLQADPSSWTRSMALATLGRLSFHMAGAMAKSARGETNSTRSVV